MFGHEHFPWERHVAVTFDSGQHSDWLRNYAVRFASGIRGPKRVVHVGFGDVAEFPPLQAADILATEAYWVALHELKTGSIEGMRPHLRHLLGHIVARGNMFDRDAILATTQRVNEFRAMQGLPPFV
jgi:hypothetical protein